MVDRDALLRRIGADLSAGREALSLWASDQQVASDPLTRHFASAIRTAVKAADRDGDAAFNATLLHGLGLTREKPGRPPKPFPVDDLERFLRRNPDVTDNSLKKTINALDKEISEGRALSYIVGTRRRIASGEPPVVRLQSERLKTVRASPAFAQNQQTMTAILASDMQVRYRQ